MKAIIQAAAILRRGGLVAFPTETVYGLGADATNPDAVAKIFAAKGRPSTNPLICHVADAEMAKRYATDWPLTASRLSEKFWPGPLTLVLPKGHSIVSSVTAGLETVGLRAPNHELTLQLIRVFEGPIAGPSANRSNHVSPTTAQHVRDEFGSSIDMILDGGPCEVGIESTVLDLSGAHPTILRPGGISRQQIESVIGPVETAGHTATSETAAKSPGQQPIHYAPIAPAYRFDPGDRKHLPVGAPVIELSADPQEYARQFYARIRQIDAEHPPAIYVEFPPDLPEWTAVRDRIIRATRALP